MAELGERFPLVFLATAGRHTPAASWTEVPLFDADDYGGRRCALCGDRIDGRRIDAEYCTTACRARAWRSERKA
ncbi:MAG: hypothetical protein HKN04_13875 [Rhodothermaceae bacterium]|nr:hypothetical protein [Rhodothermaceae bacterium]